MEQNAQPNSQRGIIILVTIVVLLLAGVTVYALQNSQTDDPVTSNPAQTETTVVTPETTDESAPAPSERMVIEFTDDGFVPEEVTVKKGTTISIMNKSSKSVQFSSDDHPVHQKNGEMNLETLGPDASATYTATKVGTWGFHDHIDESKTGTVTVTE